MRVNTDWDKIPPKEEKRDYQDMRKVRGEVYAAYTRFKMHTHIL